MLQYLCPECRYPHDAIKVQCDDCHAWVEMEEVNIEDGEQAREVFVPRKLDIAASTDDFGPPPKRLSSGQEQFDLVLGSSEGEGASEQAGAVRGLVHVMYGQKGAGKSTLMTQVLGHVARAGGTTLYVCGEESKQRVQHRARRLNVLHQNFKFTEHIEVNALVRVLEELQPDWVVVDSINKVYCSDLDYALGGPKQREESIARLSEACASIGCVGTLIARVNKDGEVLGGTDMEHDVNAVFQIVRGRDKSDDLRRIEQDKNRDGPEWEIGVLRMTEKGLVSVPDLAEVFSAQRKTPCVGAITTIAPVGSRMVPVEVHALVTEKGSGSVQSHGFDRNRLTLILSVLKFYASDLWDLSGADVFVKVPGGLQVDEPTADLAVALLVMATLRKRPTSDWCVLGEVELTGQIVQAQGERRQREGESRGYRVLAPQGQHVADVIREFLDNETRE